MLEYRQLEYMSIRAGLSNCCLRLPSYKLQQNREESKSHKPPKETNAVAYTFGAARACYCWSRIFIEKTLSFVTSVTALLSTGRADTSKPQRRDGVVEPVALRPNSKSRRPRTSA